MKIVIQQTNEVKENPLYKGLANKSLKVELMRGDYDKVILM